MSEQELRHKIEQLRQELERQALSYNALSVTPHPAVADESKIIERCLRYFMRRLDQLLNNASGPCPNQDAQED